MKVRDIMVEPAVVLRETAMLEEVARTMLDRGIGCLPLVDEDGRLKGIITESDFTGKERGLPLSAYPLRMIQRDLKRLPVVRDGVLAGMVTRHDLLELMASS